MKETLHFSPDRSIGDWFLLEHTIIRVYGFTHEPYIFPAFLTPRVFSLELIRKKLIMENEHLISFEKASEIKFPWVVGTFIRKSKVALPVIESLIHEMNFREYFAVNYDPHHIISQRRQMNKNKEFEHHVVEGLAEKDNWMEYQVHMKYAEVLHENPLVILESTEVITPTPSKVEMSGKRTHS